MDTPIKIATDIFVVRDGKILLGKRKGGFGAGEWGLPGGHLEYGECLADAARRELLEETGLSAKNFVLKTVVNLPHANKHYIYFGFQAMNLSGEPTLKEPDRCEEWRWFDINSLPENFFSSQTEHIRLFKEGALLSDQ